jgi:NAD(P)-dependent dehydrogenase (short-subunit alcohol dehydrogenase family)
VLFNNAGIFTPPAPIDEIPVEDWRRAVAVNLTGMFLCARMAFRGCAGRPAGRADHQQRLDLGPCRRAKGRLTYTDRRSTVSPA